MTTIVKAADAAQLLSLIPALFGFTPTRSVVIVPFAHGRSAGGLRVDIPPGEHVDSVAATLIGMVCRVEDADAYVAAVFDDAGVGSPAPDAGGQGLPHAGDPDRPRAASGLPHAALAAALRTRADACGLRTLEALYVGPDRWASYLDAGTGGDTATLTAPGPAASFAPEPGDDQRSGAALTRAPKAERARTAVALRQVDRALNALAGTRRTSSRGASRTDPAALATALLLDDLPEFFDAVVRSGEPSPTAGPDDAYAQAALIWCLRRPALRDVGLLTWLDGVAAGDAALDAQLRWEDGEPYAEAAGRRIWGEGPQPDAERLGAALAACRSAASVAPRACLPGVLSACAWLSWALGRTTHAEIYARHAVGIEPGHGMGGIMLAFVGAGHLPDWAFRRPAT